MFAMSFRSRSDNAKDVARTRTHHEELKTARALGNAVSDRDVAAKVARIKLDLVDSHVGTDRECDYFPDVHDERRRCGTRERESGNAGSRQR
jgi:hypothetical protein